MRRILIVDDEPLIREVLAEVLADEGYAVHSAADGQEALEAIAADLPDLVITDVMMPRLSGWDLLDRVRQQHPLLPRDRSGSPITPPSSPSPLPSTSSWRSSPASPSRSRRDRERRGGVPAWHSLCNRMTKRLCGPPRAG